ncbi:MAG: hypothetical protein K6G34_15075 [Lachnospiraceae bacterium]|nr:hypothetical protein [Lachnospiraceae bacterium]
MKRLTALVLAGVMVLSTACGGGDQKNNETAKADAGANAAQARWQLLSVRANMR